MTSPATRRVLVLHFTPRPQATRLSTQQHLDAVSRLDDPAEVLRYNAVHGVPRWLRRLRFDVVVLHTTLLTQRWSPWFPTWKRRLDWLADLSALKIAFPQDEYDHAHVLDDWLDELGVSVVCTVLGEEHRQVLYPALSQKAAFCEVLTGYFDEGSELRFRSRITATTDRPHDLVYRASKLPYWYGSHGQSKHEIGEIVARRAHERGLSHDISTRAQETVVGDAWLDFLGSGRATIGAESGSSVLDPRGEVQNRIRDLLEVQPDLSFEEIGRAMPTGWDDYRFFAISPRHLEAVATRTAQILVRGRYSGVLEAGHHYIPLEPDYSNLDDALAQLHERAEAERIAAQAYDEVFRSGSWSSRQLSTALTKIIREHSRSASSGGRTSFALGVPIAKTQGSIERLVVSPASYLLRSGPGGSRETAAGLRLVMTDRAARPLLAGYLRSAEAREHISPRQALADLLCLGMLRKSRRRPDSDGRSFHIALDVDAANLRLTLRSVAGRNPPCDHPIDRASLTALLRDQAWEFIWDHSAVAQRARFTIVGSLSTPLPLEAGVRRLPTLNWLARDRPRDVAGAIAPLIRHGGTTTGSRTAGD